MTEGSRVTVLVDSKLKQDAAEALDKMGLSLTTYVKTALVQLVNEQKIPFEIKAGDNSEE